MDRVNEAVLSNRNARGLAVLICNSYEGTSLTHLWGTQRDAEAMKSTFTHLNFATIVLRDATSADMCATVKDLASYCSYPPHYNCLAIVFSGHGRKNKVVLSNDGCEVNFEEAIIQPLHPQNSPLIGEISKIVFIDACRGNKGLQDKGDSDPMERFDLSVPGNMLVAYSTMEGYKSYEESSGGYWMQELAKQLKESRKSVGDVIADVNKEMRKHQLQEPQIWNTTVNIVLSDIRLPASEDYDEIEKDGPHRRNEPPQHNLSGSAQQGSAQLYHPPPVSAQPQLQGSPQPQGETDEQAKRVLMKFPDLDSSSSLTIKDLPLLRKAMRGVAAKWEMIAVRFKILRNEVEDFKKKFKRDSDQCLTAILVKWLRAARDCSWRAVVCAIAARVGGDNPREAEKVAREYRGYLASLNAVSNFAVDVDDTPLTLDSKEGLIKAMLDVGPSKYFAVGLALGLSYKRMEICRLEDSYEDKITQMVEFLVDHKCEEAFGLPSWKKVVTAVAVDYGGGNNALAKELARDYPKGLQARTGINSEPPSSPIAGVAASPYPSLPSSENSRGSQLPPKPTDAFKPADISSLVNDLAQVAYKWEQIAVQLGFEYDAVQNIKAKLSLIQGAPHSYLQEVLGLWLKHKPPTHEYPTKSSLINALQSKSVDELVLAKTLKEKYDLV